jgi:hypothetical protein
MIAAAIADAWQRTAPTTGMLASRLAGSVLLVETRGHVDAFEAMTPLPHRRVVWMPLWGSGRYIRKWADQAVGAFVSSGLPPSVRDWLNGEALSGTQDLGDVYRELAVSPSSAARDCYRGTVTRCADALGINDPGRDWSRWYSPAELRGLVRRSALYYGTPARDTCLRSSDPQPCVVLYKSIGGVPAPLSQAARATFLQAALRAHGARFGDMMQNSATVGDAVHALTGDQLDTTLTQWRAAVEAARPMPFAADIGTPVSTLFWVAVLAALAMRSTRWRLG